MEIDIRAPIGASQLNPAEELKKIANELERVKRWNPYSYRQDIKNKEVARKVGQPVIPIKVNYSDSEKDAEIETIWYATFDYAEGWEDWGKEIEFWVDDVYDEDGNKVDYKKYDFTDKEIEANAWDVFINEPPDEPSY